MKKILPLFLLLSACFAGRAQTITAQVVITNAPTNGYTITINGNLRYFTNVVSSTVNQIVASGGITNAQSNLFAAYSLYREPGLGIFQVSTNQVNFQSFPGLALTASVSTNWATVTLTTNAGNGLFAVRVPTNGVSITAVGAGERTNAETGLVAYLNDTAGSGTVSAASQYFPNFVNMTNTQSIYGAKTFNTSVSGTVGSFTNGTWLNGNATGTLTNQFIRTPANSWGVLASNGTAIMAYRGPGLGFLGGEDFTLYDSTGTARILWNVVGSQLNDTAGNPQFQFTTNLAEIFGTNALAPNQGALWMDGSIVNRLLGDLRYPRLDGTNVFKGPNTFNGNNILGGVVAFSRTNNSSLANGNNAGVLVGTNAVLTVSGPSGAFTINGIVPAAIDAQKIYIQNSTGFSMTIANASGVDPTAANRILTPTGADMTFTGNPQLLELIYQTSVSRWILNAPATSIAATNIAFSLIQTNFISGALYTNLNSVPIQVSANAVLTPAAVAGETSLALQISGAVTNTVGFSTLITTLVMVQTNGISGFVPAGSTYTFTNLSSGAGNSATVQGGQLFTY